MKLDELIEYLHDIQVDLDDTDNPNPEVHLAVQPNYPMRWGITNARYVRSDDRIYLASTSGNNYIESGGTPWDDQDDE